jgi:ribosomal protein L29
MKHTWNTFKASINEMSDSEKRDLLKQLHADLMYSYTRRFQDQNMMKCKLLRKQIAYIKTALNEKGFSYNPR